MGDDRHGVRLIVAYDGTAFHGWQAQRSGLRTVQATLAEAASRLSQHPVEIRGASRTDAGVHAEGQVASFSTARALSPRRWVFALNRYLPPDVSVRAAEPCPPDYEPRFDARDKVYRYLFHLGVTRHALLRDRAWHLGRYIKRRLPERDSLAGAEHLLDLSAMQAAASAMEGTHDFRAFRAAADERETTERTMYQVTLTEDYSGDPDLLALTVHGNAFMKNMVRIMAGTLIDVGRGRISPEQVRALLTERGDRRQAGMTAPPEGLTLVRVRLGRLPEGASRSDR